MTRKILAAPMALALCVSLTGCGYVWALFTDGAWGNDEISFRADGREPITETFAIDPSRFIYRTYGANDIPAEEEALRFAELALAQFQSVYNGDPHRYAELLALKDIGRALADYYPELSEIALNNGFRYDGIEKPAKYGVMCSAEWDLKILTEQEQKMGGKTGYGKQRLSDDPEARYREIQAYIADIDLDRRHTMENLQTYTAFKWTTSLAPWAGVDETTLFGMDINHCDREGDDLYISFNLEMVCGEDRYEISGVSAWRVADKWGVSIDFATMDDHIFKDMTEGEIKAYISENSANAAAFSPKTEKIAPRNPAEHESLSAENGA